MRRVVVLAARCDVRRSAREIRTGGETSVREKFSRRTSPGSANARDGDIIDDACALIGGSLTATAVIRDARRSIKMGATREEKGPRPHYLLRVYRYLSIVLLDEISKYDFNFPRAYVFAR